MPRRFFETLTALYISANDTYKFSLSVPDAFAAHELAADDSGGKSTLLESTDRAGVQVTIIPFEENLKTLTDQV